jgi:uncharacterized membrane protein YraQ (UPF0718 family)
MILLAALFGGLAPFCSCEVIPFIAGLLAVGAPLPAVMAFWLSSPLIDPPTLFITAGALGWDFAIGKAAAAVGLGLFGGFAMQGGAGSGLFADPLKGRSGRMRLRQVAFQGKPSGGSGRDDANAWRVPRRTDRNALFLVKWLALAYVLEALLIPMCRPR